MDAVGEGSKSKRLRNLRFSREPAGPQVKSCHGYAFEIFAVLVAQPYTTPARRAML